MSIVVVGAPANVLSKEDCKRHLRVDHDDDDVLIEALARAAEQHLAAPHGWVGRSIGLQTLELRLYAFSPAEIALSYGPVKSVESVTYRDASGVDATVAAESWVVSGLGETRAQIASTTRWPDVKVGAGAVRIRYVAGYEPADVPAPLRQAMLLLVSHWYENREASSSVAVTPLPMAVEALATPYRLWSI